MKYALLSLLLITTAAFGQEGAGQGPPKTQGAMGPVPTTVPTTTSPASAGKPKLAAARVK
jgi:hypothetical protein